MSANGGSMSEQLQPAQARAGSDASGLPAGNPSSWSDAQWGEAAAAVQAAGAQQAQEARAAAARFAPWGAGPPSAEQMRATFERAREALNESRPEEAARDFAALSAVRPDQAPLLFGLGLSLQMLGHHEAARDAYGAAYLIDPLDPACLLRIGECLHELKEPDQARQAWLTGLKLCDRPGVDPNLRGLLSGALDRLSV